jgi:hypothetical protein
MLQGADATLDHGLFQLTIRAGHDRLRSCGSCPSYARPRKSSQQKRDIGDNGQVTPINQYRYVTRWSIETTFEESRKYLHIESTENWSRKAVQRTIPLLFGLFSLIVLWYAEQRKKPLIRHDAWYAKNEPSFSDALTQLRTELWVKSIFPESKSPRGFLKNKKELLKFMISKAA